MQPSSSGIDGIRTGLTATFLTLNGDLMVKFRQYGLRENNHRLKSFDLTPCSSSGYPKIRDPTGWSYNFWSSIASVLVSFWWQGWSGYDVHPNSLDSVPYSARGVARDERYGRSKFSGLWSKGLTRVNSDQSLSPSTLHLSLSLWTRNVNSLFFFFFFFRTTSPIIQVRFLWFRVMMKFKIFKYD